MKQRFRSFRYRILLPVVILLLAIVTLLNTLYSSSLIKLIQQQEQEDNHRLPHLLCRHPFDPRSRAGGSLRRSHLPVHKRHP